MENEVQDLENLRITQVNSYEDARNLLGKKVKTLDDFLTLHDGDEREAKRSFGHHQVENICTALNLNEDNTEYDPDYNDTDQGKYYPWWDMETYNDDAPGSGFALDGVYYDNACALLGARLTFRSKKRAEHAAKIGLEPYRMWIRG